MVPRSGCRKISSDGIVTRITARATRCHERGGLPALTIELGVEGDVSHHLMICMKRDRDRIDDILNGKAFRGAGQGFRMEALPGRDYQRYMVQFTEPIRR